MIDPKIVYLPLLIFFAFFIIHIIVWRLLKPKKHIRSILFVFLVIPLGVSILFHICSVLFGFALFNGSGFALYILLYLTVSAVYIQTYPAIQAWSPSLFMVNRIGNVKGGLTEKEILDYIGGENVITGRVKDLCEDGYLRSELSVDGKTQYSLTKKGIVLAKIFTGYRKLLGLETGEG